MDIDFIEWKEAFLRGGNMEREKQSGDESMGTEKHPGGRKGSQIRSLKVTVVYGDAMLAECMKHIIRGKYNLR